MAERPLDENAILRQWHSRLDGLLSAATPQFSQFQRLSRFILSMAPAEVEVSKFAFVASVFCGHRSGEHHG